MLGFGVCATTVAAKGAHSVVARIDAHETIVASEEVRRFTLSDLSEEEQEGKKVDYESFPVGCAIAGGARNMPAFAGSRVCEAIGHDRRALADQTTADSEQIG